MHYKTVPVDPPWNFRVSPAHFGDRWSSLYVLKLRLTKTSRMALSLQIHRQKIHYVFPTRAGPALGEIEQSGCTGHQNSGSGGTDIFLYIFITNFAMKIICSTSDFFPRMLRSFNWTLLHLSTRVSRPFGPAPIFFFLLLTERSDEKDCLARKAVNAMVSFCFYWRACVSIQEFIRALRAVARKAKHRHLTLIALWLLF
jgi:hypothetical protein